MNTNHGRKTFWWVPFIFLLFVILSYPQGATHPKLSIEEISQTSDLIFIGTVSDEVSRWGSNNKMIFTDISFCDIKVIHAKNTSRQKDFQIIILSFAGGKVGDQEVSISGMPEFKKGERYLIFTFDDGRPYFCPVIGGPQGYLTVLKDKDINKSYLLNAAKKAVIKVDAEGLHFSKEKVWEIKNRKIIPDVHEIDKGLFLEAPVNAREGDSAELSGSEDESEGETPVTLVEFINYLKNMALKVQVKEKLIKLEGEGLFYPAAGRVKTEKPKEFDSSELMADFQSMVGIPLSEVYSSKPYKGLHPYDKISDFIDRDPGGTLGACGYQDLHIVMEQVPSSWWNYDDNDYCMWLWNQFMDLYRYTSDDGTYGAYNGESEFCGWLSDSDLYDEYGYHWGSGIAMCIYWRGFLQPTCGKIVESDVMWNSAYSWTDSDTAIGNSGVILLRPVCMHELGHTWGYMDGSYTETYDYDQPTVMHSYYYNRVENGRGIHWLDAYLVRRHYDDQTSIISIADIGVESYYASNGMINSTTNKTVYSSNESITLSNITVENMSNTSQSDVRIRLYLSTNNTISTADYQMGSYWYWSTFAAESKSVFNLTTAIPGDIPPGTYYVGAIVTRNGYNSDDYASNNATYFYNKITIPSVNITVTSSPSGRQVRVDGMTYTAPRTFLWARGSVHTIGVTSPQNYGDVRYVYSSWSDGKAQTHSIITPVSATIYIANFITQYSLTMSTNPVAGGTVSPAGTNWYNSEAVVPIQATPAAGYNFTGWSGSLGGTTNPTTITMDTPKSVVANFSVIVYTLSLSKGGSGDGQVLVNGVLNTLPYSGGFDYNATVNLEAVPDSSSTFVNWSDDLSGSTNPTSITMDSSKSVTVNFDLAIVWQRINWNNPDVLSGGDLDANTLDDVLGDFGSSGLWSYNNDSSWNRVSWNNPATFSIGEINKDSIDDILIGLASAGVWLYQSGGGWSRVNWNNAEDIVSGDLDNNGQDEFIADFGTLGLWAYTNNSGWNKLSSENVTALAAGDVDGDGLAEVVAGFGGAGVRIYDATYGWTPISTDIVQALACGDLDNNGQDEVVADFGALGLKSYDNHSNWRLLRSGDAVSLAVGNIRNDGKAEVIAGFTGLGLWLYENLVGWDRLNWTVAENIACADLNNDGKEEIVVDFGSMGVWKSQ